MSNLVKCKACGASVSRKAPACTKCGEPQKARKFGCLSVIVGGVLFVLVISAFNPGPSRTDSVNGPDATNPGLASESGAPQSPTVSITASDLYTAYDANEVAADQKYKNRYAAITGEVSNISVTFGRLQVSLATTRYGNPIICSMKSSESDRVAKLQKGQNISLQGRIIGKSFGVSVTECTIQ